MNSFLQILSCEKCQKNNWKLHKKQSTLNPIPVKDEAWCQLGMDLMGPLPVTKRGNKYVILLHEMGRSSTTAG